MRTLAQRLESSTATLYRHFANRAELATHVADRVFGEVDLDLEALASMGWEKACRTVAHSMFDVLGRHHKVAALLVSHAPIGPHALRLRERCLAVLLDSGFPPHTAARAYAALARFVLGFAIQLTGTTDASEEQRLAAVFRDLSATDFPATHAVAESLPVPLEEEFAFGLDLLVDGLRQARHHGRSS